LGGEPLRKAAPRRRAGGGRDRHLPQISQGEESRQLRLSYGAGPILPLEAELLPVGIEDILHKDPAAEHEPIREVADAAVEPLGERELAAVIQHILGMLLEGLGTGGALLVGHSLRVDELTVGVAVPGFTPLPQQLLDPQLSLAGLTVASYRFAVAAEAVVLGVLHDTGPDGIEVDVGAQHRQRRAVAVDQHALRNRPSIELPVSRPHGKLLLASSGPLSEWRSHL